MPIERLTATDRFQAGLRRAEAKMMHVVSDSQINMPMRAERYNVRLSDGTIKKITLFDSVAFVDLLKKIGGRYQRIDRHIEHGSKVKNIK